MTTPQPDHAPPLRVVVAHAYSWPEVRRGGERYLDDLCAYLAARGHVVTAVTGTHDRPGRSRGRDGVLAVRVRHRRLRGSGRLGLSEMDAFGANALAALATTKADLVHAFVPSAAIAARLARRPTLYTVLGHPTADQLPTAPVPRWLFTTAVERANAVAALSQASADAVAASVGRRALVLPPGVRLEQFAPDPSARAGPPRILLSAALDDHRKRAGLAAEAFAILRQRVPDARLVLSGQGDAADLLEPLEPETRQAVDVAGTGQPEDVPLRYRQATVTVLPSSHEAFGLALVESLASGTPVVCTPDGGMPEIVTPDVGIVARAATAEALADALEGAIALAARPETPRRCVERARRWDWDHSVGPAHEAAYRSVIRARRRSRP